MYHHRLLYAQIDLLGRNVLSNYAFLFLVVRMIQSVAGTQSNSTSASPVKHHPTPMRDSSGHIAAVETAAAGLRNRLASATSVAGVREQLSVR